MRVGMHAELYPSQSYAELCRLLLEAEKADGNSTH